MPAHGVLSIDDRRAVATRALTDVVGPAARELLGSLHPARIGAPISASA